MPASSGGCINAVVYWGQKEATGEPWADGSPHPIGQGGSVYGDGATCLHHAESATRFAPTEVWENRNPWLVNRVELIQDSCGAGKNRGGLGVNLEIEMLEDTFATTVCERTELAPWGLNEGKEGMESNKRMAKKTVTLGNENKGTITKNSGIKSREKIITHRHYCSQVTFNQLWVITNSITN